MADGHKELSQVDLTYLERTTEEIYSLDELRTKLGSKRQLRIKYGVDVTAPFLHIGHAVNLWMMRYLQECGHKVVFLIGDFTTQIGDPTGKSQTRKIIPLDEIEANAQQFIQQVSAVLHTDERVFEVRRNSEWFNIMPVNKLISLLSLVTHSHLIQRDMFQKRIESGHEIYMHELLYPILQGYDSVMLESDLTIVGNDQLFNELMGRFYQEKFGQAPQVVITTKITAGTDGKEKQSKSLGNYIAISDSPRDKFGKIMSIPDALIASYLKVYTTIDMPEIESMQAAMAADKLNPMEVKKRLATALVERYHDVDSAKAERAWFEETFSKRKTPDDIPSISIDASATVLQIVQTCLPSFSKAEIRRLADQGGISLNDQKLNDPLAQPAVNTGDILKVGKRHWFKLTP